jgi:hypothetical protein
MDQDQPPTHSNLHNDLIRIHRNNADYHRSQRDSEEQQQVTTGILPEYRASTSYTNTPPAANLRAAIDRLQYERYQQCGGRLPPGIHRLDSKYNSPNVTNMSPGDPYREWFHNTISRSHYSLGEATAHYNEWISDPDYGPNPRLNRHHNNNDSPSYLPQVHHSSSPPSSPYTSSDDTRHPDFDQNDSRAQTTVQDIHTSPDDSNTVLHSGAMITTAPRRLLMTSPEWESNIRPVPPGTAIRYGNMKTEPVEEISHIGSCALSIVPNRYRTALICVHNIVAAGHVVTLTHHETIVSDVGSSAYTLRIPSHSRLQRMARSTSLTRTPYRTPRSAPPTP